MRHRVRQLACEESGAAVVEFALTAPVLVLVLMGVFDMGYNMWATTMLQGSLQQSARLATLEGADTSIGVIDGIITDAVQDVVPSAKLAFKRKAYANFSDVSVPEDFTDGNKDGACNNGEAFEDANGNGTWDKDRGRDGNGGARDAVLYTVTMTYPRAFPMTSLIGLPDTVSTSASTVLRNQPFKMQESFAKVGACT